MSYTLEQFCQDCRDALNASPGREGRDVARGKLEQLLSDPDFLTTTLGESQEPGVETIFEDPDLKFCVLAYMAGGDRTSPPHDHGDSWARADRPSAGGGRRADVGAGHQPH
ncbi:MAG TPA: hypothetical protein EYQ83_08520 [Acidobacteria bacterium]|nr:hypothetical protein [Acidobacteriota bacterium]